MWKWTANFVLVVVFFFFPHAITIVGAFIWGMLLFRYALKQEIFAAILLIGIWAGYKLETPAMYPTLVKVSFVGAFFGICYFVYDLLKPLFNGELEAAFREDYRLNQLLRESLGQAQYVLAGESTEIFFNGSEDRFAETIAARYRLVGWGAVVVNVPGIEQIGLTNDLSGKNVVVLTAPRSPEEARNSLMVLAFSLDMP